MKFAAPKKENYLTLTKFFLTFNCYKNKSLIRFILNLSFRFNILYDISNAITFFKLCQLIIVNTQNVSFWI